MHCLKRVEKRQVNIRICLPLFLHTHPKNQVNPKYISITNPIDQSVTKSKELGRRSLEKFLVVPDLAGLIALALEFALVEDTGLMLFFYPRYRET